MALPGPPPLSPSVPCWGSAPTRLASKAGPCHMACFQGRLQCSSMGRPIPVLADESTHQVHASRALACCQVQMESAHYPPAGGWAAARAAGSTPPRIRRHVPLPRGAPLRQLCHAGPGAPGHGRLAGAGGRPRLRRAAASRRRALCAGVLVSDWDLTGELLLARKATRILSLLGFQAAWPSAFEAW